MGGFVILFGFLFILSFGLNYGNITLMFKRFFLIFIGLIIIPFSSIFAASESKTFFIDPKYDISSRKTISAQLIKTTPRINFYIDSEWLKNQSYDINQINNLFAQLNLDFGINIYPKITNIYGVPPKWQNTNWQLTIVFHSLKSGYGGYTQVEDLYNQTSSSNSNKGDIIFLNTQILKSPYYLLSSHFAHEFTHLLSLNIKLNKYGVLDDTWLEEMRAELSEIITQDIQNNFNQSILKQRLTDFILTNNFDFTRWQNTSRDYAAINILGQYLKEKYGDKILKDSLNSPYTGINSINYALKQNGYNITFKDIVKNWMIASVINDCSVNTLYCFQNPYFNRVQIDGETYYIPLKFNSEIRATQYISDLSGNWLRFVGGMDVLHFKFTIPDNTPITEIPYVIIKANGLKSVGFLDFSSKNINDVYLDNSQNNIEAVIFMPFITLGIEGIYSYNFSIESFPLTKEVEEQIIKQLQARIEELKRQIAQLQMQRALQITYQSSSSCSLFTNDLYYGMNSNEVKCLQQFLANLGSDIYPEKLITGYYGPLTTAAVKRYQAKYNLPQTGYFGPLTRAKANQEL